MAKSPTRKLKVFQAQFGFYDTVVAAPSQAAALRAWGTRQNLFASGEAKITTDEGAIAAATAHPETLLRRAVGSTDPFVLEPTKLPSVPDAPKKATVKAAPKAQPAARSKPPADRSKLEAAEKALSKLDENRKREEAAFRREAEDLEIRRMAAQSAYVEKRKAATSKLVNARTDYRKAGGAD
ncbi:MAG: hypothetical protein Q8M88_04465 [Phenylobacterium sp.]|uniref:hypothetical protein n=1 Tax=Phenylobacterium sp. TaxID=1871053 RepID=UPI0027370E1F|nr:hypothetical protein [Phenylobacterium sp.]MDP3173669.1 hypothetical protein [Phenylobacterium sp.]